MTESTRESYRATFAGVVQGSCEECGNCDDECPCDGIIERLVDSALSIREEDHDALLAENKRMREALERQMAIAEASGFTSDDFGEAYARISTHIDTDDLCARVSNRYNIILAALAYARDGYLASAHAHRSALSRLSKGEA